MLLEVDDHGNVLVPAALIQAPPHSRLDADRQGDAVVLKPSPELTTAAEAPQSSFWKNFPTVDCDFTDPNASLRREDLYDDWGR